MFRKFFLFKFYVLKQPFSCEIDTPKELTDHKGIIARYEFITLKRDKIVIDKNYTWDGASGISWDNTPFIFASIVHDALYALIREGKIPVKYRKWADDVMWAINRHHGMWRVRCFWTWAGVRLFGGSAIRKKKKNTSLTGK